MMASSAHLCRAIQQTLKRLPFSSHGRSHNVWVSSNLHLSNMGGAVDLCLPHSSGSFYKLHCQKRFAVATLQCNILNYFKPLPTLYNFPPSSHWSPSSFNGAYTAMSTVAVTFQRLQEARSSELFHVALHPLAGVTTSSSMVTYALCVLNAAQKCHEPLTKRYGWSMPVLQIASKQLGTALVCSRSDLFELSQHLLDTFVQRLENEALLMKEELQQLAFESQLESLLCKYISYFTEYQPYWYQAHYIRQEQGGPVVAITFGYKLADKLYELCYGVPENFHWNSYRCILSMLYAAAEAHIMSDTSPNLAYTQKLISSKLEFATFLTSYLSMSYAVAWSLASIAISLAPASLRNS